MLEDGLGKKLENTTATERDSEKLDALFEERFSEGDREEMAREIAAQDAGKGSSPGGTGSDISSDISHIKKNIEFHGEMPEKIKTSLRDWTAELIVYAASQGLKLKDLNHQISFYSPKAFHSQVAPIPPGIKLPASSYIQNKLYGVYTVRVVLPDPITSSGQFLTILRALLSRLMGEIYLAEEVFSLAAYREDRVEKQQEVSASMEEKIKLLAEENISTPTFEATLKAYGEVAGLNYKRLPAQVRKAYFKEIKPDVENGKISQEREMILNALFTAFCDSLNQNLEGTTGETVAEVEKLNRAMNFLPPAELPTYQKLKEENPLHYLRSAQFRLGQAVEIMASFSEDFADLEAPAQAFSPLVDERVQNQMTQLRTENLARPYLVEGVRLSDELEKKKQRFPLEVHNLLNQMPAAENPRKKFESLSKKLKNSLHQKLYTALLLGDAFLKAKREGSGGNFAQSEQFATFKGLLANFRFRLPLLEALHIKSGVVLDMADLDKEGGKQRFPAAEYTKAWSQFIPHALLVSFFEGSKQLPGLDTDQYQKTVLGPLTEAVKKSPGPHCLTYFLNCLHRKKGGEGLSTLSNMMAQPNGTFRFTINQVLNMKDKMTGEERLAQLEHWAGVLLEAWLTREKYVIQPGDLP